MSQKLDRVPPHSMEAEEGVLGCILLDPNESMEACVNRLKMGDEAFYELRSREVYKTFLDMWEHSIPIDILTLIQRLKGRDQLENCGGMPRISELSDKVPSAANLPYYLDILVEKHMLRSVISTCTESIASAWKCDRNVDKLIDEVEASVLKIRDTSVETPELSMKQITRRVIDILDDRFHNKSVGLSTGFPTLDNVIGGLKPGSMFVVAARPSAGKTALALNIAANVANAGSHVGIFSLEMTKESLAERMISSKACVNMARVTQWTQEEMQKSASGAVWASKLPIHIDDGEGISSAQIRARARRWKRRHDVKLIIIDYLQLIQGRRGVDRREAVDEISRDIKGLSKELDIPVIVLAQLNRDVEKDKSRKPRLSDLRESGQIEQDGDVIGMLYRADVNQNPTDMVVGINLLIVKQRNGLAGVDVGFRFHREFTRFEYISPIDE